ncbi:MAG: hypothetical protein H0X72_20960 [Acidobacteria bacterium]|nr:hypothetical protein [Acidobacteriota bacterium]
MAWIKTIPFAEADKQLREAIRKQRALFPPEYAAPTSENEESIITTHTLIPGALLHAFSTFGVLMSPDLPLSRKDHEMIATVVSIKNDCHY